MAFTRKDLLGIRELSVEEINTILDTAASFKEVSARAIKKVPALRGKTVINLFFEPSTRTRTSFEIAAKRLSADAVNISASTSSVSKGESLIDTAQNLQAMAPDVLVMRHPASGAPYFVARRLAAAVVNAGDGMHEHPTQALLDAFTIRERKGTIASLRIAIVGDILHSRVFRSNVRLLTRMGSKVFVAGPPTLLPPEVEKLGVAVARVGRTLPTIRSGRARRRGRWAACVALVLAAGLGGWFVLSPRPDRPGVPDRVSLDVVALAWAELRQDPDVGPVHPATEAVGLGGNAEIEPLARWALAGEPTVPSWMVELAALAQDETGPVPGREEN